MPKMKRLSSGGGNQGASGKDREWEEAFEAVLRDIAASTTAQPPVKPIVQIVFYESNV